MGAAAFMSDFESDLGQRLASLGEQGLYRQLSIVESPQSPRLQIAGSTLLNFSSNDYLCLANHPALKEAAIHAVERFGAGAGASRLICGSLAPHHELDEALAAFKGTQAALAFSTGYAAAMGAICALMQVGDVIILDKLVHACIVDSARLCGATLRVFRHNDLKDLERLLHWSALRNPNVTGSAQSSKRRVLVVTESVFSMDGDHAPLREIVELKKKYDAWLMLDEAHATGLYGTSRRGLAEEQGTAAEIEIQMGTLGKAAGAAGGYICGSKTLIDYLVNRARTFIYSTAPVPAAAAAATAGIRLIQSSFGEERRKALWQLVSTLPSIFTRAGSKSPSAIIPIPIGDETKAVETAADLRRRGIFIPAIRYPTVARGHARLRLTLTAGHTKADMDELLTGLVSLNLADAA
jgi:8-amino-7-oxononanoate synthase